MYYLLFFVRVFLLFCFGALVIQQTEFFWFSVILFLLFSIVLTVVEFAIDAYSDSLF